MLPNPKNHIEELLLDRLRFNLSSCLVSYFIERPTFPRWVKQMLHSCLTDFRCFIGFLLPLSIQNDAWWGLLCTKVLRAPLLTCPVQSNDQLLQHLATLKPPTKRSETFSLSILSLDNLCFCPSAVVSPSPRVSDVSDRCWISTGASCGGSLQRPWRVYTVAWRGSGERLDLWDFAILGKKIWRFV